MENREKEALKKYDSLIASYQFKLGELKSKLYSLTEKVEKTGSYDARGGDVYGGITTFETRGSKVEIERVKAEIRKLEAEIRRLEANKHSYASRDVKDSIRAKEQKAEERQGRILERQADKQERVALYKSIKRSYSKRKGHGFERFVTFVQGKSPNWKKIKGYSLEELRYLDKSSTSMTRSIKDQVKETEKKMIKAGKTGKDIEKRISRQKWDYFVRNLQSKVALDKEIAIDSKGKGL